MSVDILDRIYDAYTGEMGQQFMRETQQRVHWMCARASGHRVLDVGCSQGVLPILLGREGKEVLGIDSSAQAIKAAENHLASEPIAVRKLVTFIDADFTQHAFAEQRFDSIVLGEVLEHLLDPARFIDVAAQLLEPGGHVVVTVPFGINDHVDHKHTFYLRGPYRLLAKHFDVVEVSVLGKWLGLVGVRRTHGEATETWSDELLSQLEAAFQTSERGLVDELTSVRTRLDDANTKYRSSTEEVARLKREVAHHEAERKQAERTRSQLEAQLSSPRQAETEAQPGPTAQLLEEREIRHAREISLARLEERLNHSSQLRQLEIETRDSEIARLNLVRAQLSSELSSAQGRLQAVEQELALVTQQKTEALATLARQLGEAERRAEELDQSRTRLERQLREAEQAHATEAGRWSDERQEWLEAQERWESDTAAWNEERAQARIIEQQHQAASDEQRAALASLRVELAATRPALLELEQLKIRLDVAEAERSRAEQTLRQARERTVTELSVAQKDAERVLETQRAMLRDAQSKLAQGKRELDDARRAEQRSKAELHAEKRERTAAERRVAQTRNTLSFQLGYELIHGFKSRESLLALPASLWQLNQEAARRRREKQSKHQVPIRPIAPAAVPVAPPAVARAPVAAPAPAPLPLQAKAPPSAAAEPVPRATPARVVAPPTSLAQLRIACIHDEFTFAAFAPECQLQQLTPKNWQAEMEAFKPDLLFVESAWRGKDEQWTRKVAHRSQEILDIVEWCRKAGVPTAFWNKEDPVHFRTFLNTAKLFDFVFTTDIDCIARYQRGLGHERVYLLPFAVQPKAHNPLEKYERKDAIAFAGAYYARYPERQADLESFVEHMASAPRLEIYDRNLGKTDPDYQFPERYQPHIVGTLKFDEIDLAYKGYRYALNLNSIKASQSMFARRVFELLACNTITVSNFSRGVRLLFGDLVITTDSGEHAVGKLRELANDEARARRFRLAGLRKVLREHTYENRLRFVASQVWNRPLPDPSPKVLVLAAVQTRAEALLALRSFEQQTWPHKRLLLVSADASLKDLARAGVVEFMSRAAAGQRSVRELGSNVTHVATCVTKDHYGANYLTDLALATTYSDAAVLCKATHFVLGSTGLALHQDGAQYRPAVRAAVRAALCRINALPARTVSSWLDDAEHGHLDHAPALAVDEFNYCEAGAGAPAALLREVDDLTDIDAGLEVSQLLESAAKVRVTAGAVSQPQIGADKLARILRPARGKPLTIALEGEHLVVHSSLADETHEYVYASEAWAPSDLGLPSPGRLHFSATPGLNVQLAVLFLDKTKNRIAHKLCQPGANETISLPQGAEAVQLGLRVYGSGSAKLGGLLLDHVQEAPHAIFGRSDYLLLTNRYPSRQDLYRNAFVHRRVAEYAKGGCSVDVFRMQPGRKLSYYEFDGTDVISGDAQALQALLESTSYKAILIHFLDAAMWEALAPYAERTRLLIWAHGAEIQAWHRREAHYATRAQLEAAQAQAEPRRHFWRDVAGSLDESSKLVFVSSHFAREVIGDLGLELPTSRYEVIHNVIDTELFAYQPKTTEQRRRVLSIRPHTSRIYANDLAVATVLELSQKPYFNELEFHFVGDGPLFEETMAPLRALPNIRIEKRFLTQAEIAKLHREYGIFLCPSRGDTQGVSRDEAMASGLVPVTTRAGAIPEFVDANAGFVVDLEDVQALASSIERLYQDPQLFSQLSQQAAARVRRQSSPAHTTARELSLIRGEA